MGPLVCLILLFNIVKGHMLLNLSLTILTFFSRAVGFLLRKLRFPLSTWEVNSRAGKTLVLMGVWKDFFN